MSLENKTVDLSLSIKPEQEVIISNLKKQLLQEDLNDLPPIEEDIINISTVYVFDIGDKIEASIFIRNGLKNNLNIEQIKLNLVNEKQELIISQKFNLKEIGTIPPRTARPWKIYFKKNNLNKQTIDLKKCKVIFDKGVKAIDTVDIEPEDYYENTILNENIKTFINNLYQLKVGKVDAHLYNLDTSNDDKIILTIIFRNGSNHRINIDNLNIEFCTQDKKKIYSKVLTISKFKVKSKKAKLYNLTLNFDKDKYKEVDFKNILFNIKGVSYSEIEE